MSKNTKPVAKRITDWLLTIVPEAHRDKIKAAFAALADEQDGFVRNGNRTDYRRDQLAFASSGVEQTDAGPVFVYSTMKGRRVEDLIFAYLMDHASTFIFPPTKREDGKLQRHTKARESWCASLGFAKQEVGKGQRQFLNLELRGAKQLISDLGQMVPERFEGTEAPTSTKAQVKFILPASLGAVPVNISLYDPEQPSVDEAKFKEDLAKVSLLLDGGVTFAPDRKGDLTRVATLYDVAYKATKQAQAPASAAA